MINFFKSFLKKNKLDSDDKSDIQPDDALIVNSKKNSLKFENQTLSEWCEIVREFELDRAKKKLKNNVPVDVVINEMANRINNKIFYFFLQKIDIVTIRRQQNGSSSKNPPRKKKSRSE